MRVVSNSMIEAFVSLMTSPTGAGWPLCYDQRMTSTGICTRTLCADIPACGRRLRKSRFPCRVAPS